jgi:hypothetical protein
MRLPIENKTLDLSRVLAPAMLAQSFLPFDLSSIQDGTSSL